MEKITILLHFFRQIFGDHTQNPNLFIAQADTMIPYLLLFWERPALFFRLIFV